MHWRLPREVRNDLLCMMSKNWKSLQDLSLLQIGSLLDLLDTGFGTLWWVHEKMLCGDYRYRTIPASTEPATQAFPYAPAKLESISPMSPCCTADLAGDR